MPRKDGYITRKQAHDLKNLMKGNYREFLHALGQQTVNNSQRNVPVQTGQLKASIEFSKEKDGFKIRYLTDYAATVHEGSDRFSGAITEPWVSKVKKHKRKTSRGTVMVKAHKKKYKEGFKPTKGVEGWHTRDTTAEVKSNPWIQDSWHDVRNKLPRAVQKLLPKNLYIDVDQSKSGGSSSMGGQNLAVGW